MKKIILVITLISISFLNFNYVNAMEKITVKLDKCVDGDTAWFYLNDEEIKTRFLAIDTPESTNKIEEYGKEASNYTCKLLTNSKKIEIEYDNNSDKFDKYDRHLVWVYVDNNLLQNLIIEQGLGEVAYLYGDYSYTSILQDSELIAKSNKIGIWSDYQVDYTNLILIIVFIIIALLTKTLTKSKLKKYIKIIKKV